MNREGGFPKIIADQSICHGQPTFAGTRIMVWQVLELLEVGETPQKIHRAYPTLPKGAVQAALHFAAEKIKGISYFSFNGDEFCAQVFT